MESDRYEVVSVREFLLEDADKSLTEEDWYNIVSSFSCPLNPDVQSFLKDKALQSCRLEKAVSYLVLSKDNFDLLGYFALALQSFVLEHASLSNTQKRKVLRSGCLDMGNNTYQVAAFLIGQLGKNYSSQIKCRISGDALLELAMEQIRRIQYLAGGKTIVLETLQLPQLIAFYERNGFRQFGTRTAPASEREGYDESLVQMISFLH